MSRIGVAAMTLRQSMRVRNAVCTGDHPVVTGNGSGRNRRKYVAKIRVREADRLVRAERYGRLARSDGLYRRYQRAR